MLNISNTSSYLSTLIGAGEDAHQNLYYVRFIGSSDFENADMSNVLKVRADDISLPTPSHGTDSISYMTVSMDKPNANYDIDKSISISFRVDDNYEVYKFLLDRQAKTSKANLGYAGDYVQGSDNYFYIAVYAMTKPVTTEAQEDPTTAANSAGFKVLYRFKHCWIPSINGLSFSYSGSNVQKVTAKIFFWDYTEPGRALQQ